MAYRFDAGVARGVDLAHITDTASHFQFSLDGGHHYAALSPTISPTSHSFTFANDFASRAATPFSQHGPLGVHALGPNDAAAAGSPADLDTVPGDNTSTVTLNVLEGQAIAGTINAAGVGGVPPAPGTDADWYKVTLTAGTSYEFHLTQADTSASGPDFRLTLYDAAGAVAGATSDSGGMGEPEELHYTAASSGTYYISADNFTPIDLGDYTISGEIDGDAGETGGTPLAAIDWGGPDNKMTDNHPEDGITRIKVYYGKPGEVFGSPDDPVASVGWDEFAKEATMVAFDQYEHVVNVRFTEVANKGQADWILVQTVTAPALLGQMRPPGEANAGLGDFNKAGFDYDEASCAQGGYSYITFIHEFGHGMGMAHPHDTGGGSEVMHGVTGDVATGYTTGDFGLNQGIYTTMSYNDGWPDGPDGNSDSTAYGYQGTLMALDVAMMQIKYGANEHYHTGDNLYRLWDANAPGTMYACIWDAGGEDTIAAQGTLDSVIDLRPATLEYEVGGGGFISHETGIYGGYTIAHDVVIENAKGAGGKDTITGNDAANHLSGGSEQDTIVGGDGNDVLTGERGNDSLTGGDGEDTFVFGTIGTASRHNDLITDLSDLDMIDLSGIDADTSTGTDDMFTQVANFHHVAGELVVRAGIDTTRFLLDTDGDGAANIVIYASGNHASFDNFAF